MTSRGCSRPAVPFDGFVNTLLRRYVDTSGKTWRLTRPIPHRHRCRPQTSRSSNVPR